MKLRVARARAPRVVAWRRAAPGRHRHRRGRREAGRRARRVRRPDRRRGSRPGRRAGSGGRGRGGGPRRRRPPGRARRGRRPHPHAAAGRRGAGLRRLRDRHRRGRGRRHDHRHRLRDRLPGRRPAGRPGDLAALGRAGGGGRRPAHDLHRGRARGGGGGLHRAGGDQLQAVPGLSPAAAGRRRGGGRRHAGVLPPRRPGHRPLRERRRDRGAAAPGAGRGPDRGGRAPHHPAGGAGGRGGVADRPAGRGDRRARVRGPPVVGAGPGRGAGGPGARGGAARRDLPAVPDARRHAAGAPGRPELRVHAPAARPVAPRGAVGGPRPGLDPDGGDRPLPVLHDATAGGERPTARAGSRTSPRSPAGCPGWRPA